MKKDTMKKLDEINLEWLLKQISLGNVVRGIQFIAGLVEPIKSCLVKTTKAVIEELQTNTEEETPHKKRTTEATA